MKLPTYHPFPYHRDNTIFRLALQNGNSDSAIIFLCELADDKGRIVKGIAVKQRYEVPYPVTREQANELIELFSCHHIPGQVELRDTVRLTAVTGINISLKSIKDDLIYGYIHAGTNNTMPSWFYVKKDILINFSDQIKNFYAVNPVIDGDSILSPYNPQPKEELDVIVDNINKYKQEQRNLAASKKWWQLWL